jgi:histone H3/H4
MSTVLTSNTSNTSSSGSSSNSNSPNSVLLVGGAISSDPSSRKQRKPKRKAGNAVAGTAEVSNQLSQKQKRLRIDARIQYHQNAPPAILASPFSVDGLRRRYEPSKPTQFWKRLAYRDFSALRNDERGSVNHNNNNNNNNKNNNNNVGGEASTPTVINNATERAVTPPPPFNYWVDRVFRMDWRDYLAIEKEQSRNTLAFPQALFRRLLNSMLEEMEFSGIKFSPKATEHLQLATEAFLTDFCSMAAVHAFQSDARYTIQRCDFQRTATEYFLGGKLCPFACPLHRCEAQAAICTALDQILGQTRSIPTVLVEIVCNYYKDLEEDSCAVFV